MTHQGDDADVDLIEIELTGDLPLVGTRLRDNPPPTGMLVTTVIRDNRATIANAETVFAAGDVLMLAVSSEVERVTEVTAWARGETGAGSDPERP